jgi:hypothetical protein
MKVLQFRLREGKGSHKFSFNRFMTKDNNTSSIAVLLIFVRALLLNN